MQLNSSKCQHVCFTRSHILYPSTYSIQNNQLKNVSSYKYLGVNINSELKWGTHINYILSAADRSLGYLKHHLRLEPHQLKKTAYTTLLRPKLEYASSIWDPHLAYQINEIEAFQNRAKRLVFSDYSRFSSITNSKIRANLPSLQLRRTISRLTLLHKFYYNNNLRSNIINNASVILPRLNHSCKLESITCRTTSFFK